MASSNFWHSTSTKSTSIGGVKISIYFAKYTYFFYFTQPLLQDAYISLAILHIYSIKYSFFYIFYYFLTHYLSLSHTQNHQHPATINDQSTPTINSPNHHHQPTLPPSTHHQRYQPHMKSTNEIKQNPKHMQATSDLNR